MITRTRGELGRVNARLQRLLMDMDCLNLPSGKQGDMDAIFRTATQGMVVLTRALEERATYLKKYHVPANPAPNAIKRSGD
jgi:hypothetical protein